MAMFDYKNYSTEDAAKLVDDAHRLSAYTNAYNFSGLPGADLLNLLGDVAGSIVPNDIDVAVPSGWKEIMPADLGLSDDLLDKSGYFKIESFYTGTDIEGPQAKIFAQYDDAGEITRINLNFSGTNSLLDVIDYLNLNSREGAELFDPILNIVKDFAVENGLGGSDVLISGYSLGAGLTNVVAEERANLADGFFTDADYIAFEVPKIYDNADVVLNIGYENDVVHRIAGDADSFGGAMTDLEFGLINPDRNFESSTDNLVLFNDVYASAIWNLSPFSLLNIPTGWYAHINGVTTDAITRIQDSTFYDYTHKDSTVVVADLTAISRSTTWVRDRDTITSDHFDSSAFLVGSDHDDLIEGGKNNDHIDAGLGDDTIKAGLGVDHVDGNLGSDEIRLNGRGQDWDIYQTQDDTLFFIDKDGINLVEADNVESVSFNDELLSRLVNYDISDSGLIDNRPIVNKLANGDINFGEHVEGSTGNDELTGNVIFARAGDDTLTGTADADVLHAGMGDDVLIGGAGDDRLYGAEDNDMLIGGAGDDQLIGGLGNDVFVIGSGAGSDTIVDFNNDIGYQDVISFSADIFSSTEALSAQVSQEGANVIVNMGNDVLTINNTVVDDVLAYSIIA